MFGNAQVRLLEGKGAVKLPTYLTRLLEVSRSLVYYHLNKEELDAKDEESKIEKYILDIFHRSRNNYGTRKIKVELDNLGYQVSRKRIARIMKENALVSNYTVGQYSR